MKRIVSFALALMFLYMTGIVVYADLGNSDFDNWEVVCGPEGYAYEDVLWYNNDPDDDMSDYINPGEKLVVHSFDEHAGKYLLLFANDSKHDSPGAGFVYVSEKDLNEKFIGTRKVYTKDHGKEQAEVTCVVTSDDGVNLRQGPSTNYPTFKVVPQNAKLSYRYVYHGDKYDWGYVTYKGQDGWICINYTQDVRYTTTTKKPTTNSTSKKETEPATKIENTTPNANDSQNEATVHAISSDKTGEKTSFFSSTRAVIVFCCFGAIVIALTAIVILLIIKRKKDESTDYIDRY